ncbi:plasmid recombination protein, partial [Comamonas jiangduensis]|uniref:plasmid recombination protein n=1 Tax=Comamonas jiangduensis TaxID=1194168 RepID=UPI003BF8AD5C
VLLGPQTADAVNAAYKAQLKAAGIDKLRVDAVRLIEALVSLPVGIQDKPCAYFKTALDWLGDEFGTTNLLSAVVHNDESAQHMHVLIVPLVNSRMQGSDLLGGKAQLQARLARFEQAMQGSAAALGLPDPAGQILDAQEMARTVIRELQQRNDPMWKSSVAQLLRNCIEDSPQQFYAALAQMIGQSSTVMCPARPRCRNKRMKTMAEIFTKPIQKMRGAAAERYRKSAEYRRAHVTAPSHATHQAIGPDIPNVPEIRRVVLPVAFPSVALPGGRFRMRTLCSVGFAAERVILQIHSSTVLIAAVDRPAKSEHLPTSAICTKLHAGSFAQRCTASFCYPTALQLDRRLLRWWLRKARAS